MNLQCNLSNLSRVSVGFFVLFEKVRLSSGYINDAVVLMIQYLYI